MAWIECHCENGNKLGGYAVITPEAANLLGDILQAIPYEQIQNNATGSEPKGIWEQLVGAIGGATTSVANFIHRGLVALANLIEHAAEVAAQFAMKLWSTGVSVVKQAVEVIKKAVDAVVEWVKGEVEKAYKAFLDANKNVLENVIAPLNTLWNEYKESRNIDKGLEREFWDAIMRVVYISMAVWATITALLYIVIGATFGSGYFIVGAIGAAIWAVSSIHAGKGDMPGWLNRNLGKESLVRKIAEDIGNRYTDSGMDKSDVTSFFLSLFSMGLSFIGWAISAIGEDVSGTMAGMVSAAVGTAAIIFGILLKSLRGDSKEHMRWIVYGFSLVGIFIGLVGTAQGLIASNWVSAIISMIGLLLSAVTLGIAMEGKR